MIENPADSTTVSAATAAAAPQRPRFNPSTIAPSADVHRQCRPSPLSSESPEQDFRGLYNLAGLFMIAMAARLVLENIVKYGWLFRFAWIGNMILYWHAVWPHLLLAVAVVVASPAIAYKTEVAAAVHHSITNERAALIHTIHIVLVFLLPQVIIVLASAAVGAALVLMFITFIMTLKLISYAHVCHDIRVNGNSGSPSIPDVHISTADSATAKKTDTVTPDDKAAATTHTATVSTTCSKSYIPSLSHTFYFIAAPTLCFQLAYPRSPRIRLRFCVRRLIELAFCLSLMNFLIEQYVVPTVNNALPQLRSGAILPTIERVLKLALPFCCFWLLMFYALFQAWLNLTAELLRFGDRAFYKDWWNATSLDVYWRNWNIPVHNFVVRHIYAPSLRRGFSIMQAQAFAFFVSAVAHELLVSVPCQMPRLHAFFGMFLQVPLIVLTRLLAVKMQKPVWGNVIFWVFFVVFGQPLLILIYSYEYLSRQNIQSIMP